MTPLQMVTAFSAIANQGYLPEPTLVLGTRDPLREVLEPRMERAPKAILARNSAVELLAILEGVVENGTGIRAQVPGYKVAGKTGTAWKPRSEGGYGEETGDVDYVASFVGILPADDPELVVLVVVDEPAIETYSGGRAAAPIFSGFAKFAVRQRRIPSESERIGLDESGRVMAATPAQMAILEAVSVESKEDIAVPENEVAAAFVEG